MNGAVKLSSFPIRHPDTSMRRRHAGQISLMQSIARREFHEERHRCPHEFRMARPGIFPDIHVWPDDPARLIHIGAVKAGSVILVFADDPERTDRRPMPFAAARDSGRCREMASVVKISLLLMQLNDDRRPAGMPLRHVGRHHLGHGAATAQAKGESTQ